MRARPNSKPVLSDDEVANSMRADGYSGIEINDRLAVRRTARERAQAEYDAGRALSTNGERIRAEGLRLFEQMKREREAEERAAERAAERAGNAAG